MLNLFAHAYSGMLRKAIELVVLAVSDYLKVAKMDISILRHTALLCLLVE